MKKVFHLIATLILVAGCNIDEPTHITPEPIEETTEPQAIDLGLSVKWASFNLGAAKPEEAGTYYSWGETETKKTFALDGYKWFNNESESYTKYLSTDENIGILEDVDDVANKEWGGAWRMPTAVEFNELLENCSFAWGVQQGIKGYFVTSLMPGYTDVSIFIPAAGYRDDGLQGINRIGYYWTSDLGNEGDEKAFSFTMGQETSSIEQSMRYLGYTIRPVQGALVIPEKISLDKTEVELYIGQTVTLDATVTPQVSTGLVWESSNPDIADVDNEGLVTAKKPGSAVIRICWGQKKELSASCQVTVSTHIADPVDLGLSVKWASFNLGASQPSEPGYFYAWGETAPRDTFNEGNYLLSKFDGKSYKLLKYNGNPEKGNVDNMLTLVPEDDAAYCAWGGFWRMPTLSEVWELSTGTEWEWTKENGVEGYRLTSKVEGFENQSIFLPAVRNNSFSLSSKDGLFYWSSSLYTNNNDYSRAEALHLYNGTINVPRFCGALIRPVYCESEVPTGISLDRTEVNMLAGMAIQLFATTSPEDKHTSGYTIWSSSNSAVASVDGQGNVTAKRKGTAIITATCSAVPELSASCKVTVGDLTSEAYVDLGLSVKWASCNLGAKTPTGNGNYYSWGETKAKSFYDWSTYMWCNGSEKQFTKYCSNPSYGKVDKKIILDTEDDAAHVNLGGQWRIPTHEEWSELIEKCEWQIVRIDGVQYFHAQSTVKGYTDKYIIIPLGGKRKKERLSEWTMTTAYGGQTFAGFYWASTKENNFDSYKERHFGIDKDYNYDCYPYGVLFGTTIKLDDFNFMERSYGFSIRPVYGDLPKATDISIDRTSVEICVGETAQLEAKLHPALSSQREICWESSNPEVAAISSSGEIIGKKEGTAVITAKVAANNSIAATCSVTVFDDYSYKAVDLGLSVKWSSCNIGAFFPEDYGVYFAWGETSPKSIYNWPTLKYCSDEDGRYFSKYVIDSDFGKVDGMTSLEPCDDAAHKYWGGTWRMPTEAEWKELQEECTWAWTSIEGHNGYKVTSKKNGNSIFLPAAGFLDYTSLYNDGSDGFYWSSSLHSVNSDRARTLHFYSDYVIMGSDGRYRGHSVRPVSE